MKKRNYLIKVRRSRKSFLGYYLMILIVMGLLFHLYRIGDNPNKLALNSSIIFIFLILIYIEYTRLKDWWAITEGSIVQSQGLLNKNIREIDFSSISDLDLDQTFSKRILNYGNINVRLFLNETSIKIPNINKPEIFIEELQGLISGSRRKGNGIRKV